MLAGSWSDLISRKIGPQIGMVREPCDVTPSSPEMMLRTRADGNAPPLFFAITVRSAGCAFSCDANGPSPLASRPWQAAQYWPNNSDPPALGAECSCLLFGKF